MAADRYRSISTDVKYLSLDWDNFMAIDPGTVNRIHKYFEIAGLFDALYDIVLCATSKVSPSHTSQRFSLTALSGCSSLANQNQPLQPRKKRLQEDRELDIRINVSGMQSRELLFSSRLGYRP